MTRPRVALALIAATSLTAGARSQQAPVFRSTTDLVSVDVSVRSRSGPVPSLAPADFDLLDNGVAQKIDAFSREALPIDVTLLLDTSRSVSGALLQRLKQGVTDTAALLKHDDALRVLALQSRIREVLAFQPGGTQPVLDALTAMGGTPLYDGLAVALMREGSPDRRQLVVVYTDGQDTLSALDLNRALDLAMRADPVMHVVMPTDPARPKLVGPDSAAAARMKDLVARTGGQVFFSKTDDGIGDAFRQAIEEFRTSYVLRYTPAGVARTGWHDILVRVKTGQYEVRFRKGYDAGR